MKLAIFFLAILSLTAKPLHALPNGAISDLPAAKEGFAAGPERGLKGRKNKGSKEPKRMMMMMMKKNATTADPTAAKQRACNFLSIPNLTTCLSTLSFNYGTTGSTIPSEIGLSTQLTYLDFFDNSLTSTIPSEIGLLTQLTFLDFSDNDLTSTIPKEIGLLTQLTFLFFNDNVLMGTIPASLCSLPTEGIYIDCGEITCASGCCISWPDDISCG